MPAYTQQNLTDIRQAKLDLGMGNRIGSVTIMGQVISYESTTLAALTKLESQIIKSLRPKRIRDVSLQYSKGV